MASLSPNLSISLSQQRWACVLDPSLFLSRYGLLLVQSLGEILELWVARELWHILDNPDYYFTQPEFVLPQTGLAQSLEHQLVTQQTKMRVLRQWELVRTKTPPTNLNLFWFGDKPGESFLPDGTDPQLIVCWEGLARSLEARLQSQSTLNTMLAPAFRDTVALAAVLGSAFILTYQPIDNSLENSNRTSRPPDICLVLEQWGIACQQINPLDAIVAIERENLLQLIISTGLSKFLWAGLHLVILHLVVPSAFTSYHKTQRPWIEYFFNEASDSEISSTIDFWEEAQGFWYYL